MASTLTKNILLSHPGINLVDDISVVNLKHEIVDQEEAILVKIEVPGVDPESIDIQCENNTICVISEKGEISIPFNPTTEVDKIQADVKWGLLTLLIPKPAPPVAKSIKIKKHDAPAPSTSRQGKTSATTKTSEKFTEDTKGVK